MANEARGEIEVTGKDGATYVFRPNSNSISALEAEVNQSSAEMAEDLRRGRTRIGTLRAFVRHVVITKHPLSQEEAGELLDKIGTLQAIECMTSAMLRLYGIAPGGKKEENPRRPTSGRRTGAGGSSVPAKQD